MQCIGARVGREVDELLDLIDGALQSLLNEHGGGHPLCLGRVDAKQRAELLEGDIVVQLGRGEHVVLDDRALEHRGAVVERRHLVRRQRGREGRHLVLAQQPLHEHLLEHSVARQPRGALVLVERAEQARALRPRWREYGAGDRLQQRLGELRLRDRARAEGLALQLRELVVACACLEELALRVEDARVAHLVQQAQRRLGLLRDQQRGAVD
mmetsp:Transcript_14903/g.35239  ORF Transcript_14903/g.35239 Transcript_14903/m.35239 type:complete len:212 (+) Transcript_14903:362-997(+)